MLRLIRRSWNGETDQAIWICVFVITLTGIVVIVPFAQSDPPGSGGPGSLKLGSRFFLLTTRWAERAFSGFE